MTFFWATFVNWFFLDSKISRIEKTDAKIKKEKYLGPKIDADFAASG